MKNHNGERKRVSSSQLVDHVNKKKKKKKKKKKEKRKKKKKKRKKKRKKKNYGRKSRKPNAFNFLFKKTW